MKQRPVRFSRYLSLRLFAARTAAVEQQMRASFAPLTTLLRVAPPAHFGPKPYDGLDRFIARARTVIETVPIVTSMVAGNEAGVGWLYLAVPELPPLVRLTVLAQALDGLRRRLRVAVGRLEKQREVLHQQIAALNALEERLSYVGLHDPVTDLPNRRLFVESLKQAVLRAARQRTRLAVLFIDFDHFKTLNDTHGHEAGDRFLIEMAARLKTSLRRSDLAARLGGDEFSGDRFVVRCRCAGRKLRADRESASDGYRRRRGGACRASRLFAAQRSCFCSGLFLCPSNAVFGFS